MKTTIINFYLEYDEEPILEPTVLKWNEINQYFYTGDEDNCVCHDNPDYVDNDPMTKFIVEYDDPGQNDGCVDGYELGKSISWSHLGIGDCDQYHFTFSSRKDAKEAKKLLPT